MIKSLQQYMHLFNELTFTKKETVLYEGDVANSIYIVKKGALRLWHNDDGKDITLQFFFENQFVSSFESFYLQQPSDFSIETIEDTVLIEINRQTFDTLIDKEPDINKEFIAFMSKRFINYMHLFLSRIKNSPELRYQELLQNNSEIIKRVPDHYIASYLGITSVSLSRIKNRN
ncbi:Crp/Fnr family transcriptional regulator [Staphylococcus sp. ACRSN]|uniref:Crp/Fnr family transcriptional regulator n=1 Tax=Staphylococcus sp. ACRSN TaxID=2918214 RepID=UPI001EF1D6D5|nr:Crp/Fnr family transcriptional regulator [Staphylococcus sp. ACRSN]MCG7338880.1 Crp/Fnr family transcriptional regulator [Staphylococcus sp. ACRSN]